MTDRGGRLDPCVHQGLAVIEGSEATASALVADDQYRSIVESAVDFAIIALDVNGIVTDWSAGAQATFGWSSEAMRGETLVRIFTPEDLASGRPGRDREMALADGRASGERWYVDAKGRRFWGHGETRPLALATTAGMSATSRSSTTRRKSATPPPSCARRAGLAT